MAGPLGVFAVLLISIAFAAMNGAQRVTVDLGIIAFYRVPVTVVAFAGLFTGMVVMLVAGVQSDLKVRSILRHRLETEDREERALIDRTQQELFPTESVVDAEEEEEEEVF
jgi:uncharacterized integral membrane protein